VQALLVAQIAKGKFVGAICAAPVALQAAGILEGQLVTAYPGFESELSGALFMEERVVDSGQIMTSRGPGTAFEFALYLVSKFVSAKKSEEIAKAMLL
jgi:4-methyl-5(b-hydroxyethyl)-thiazole monophosphate biosynthesis